MQSTDHPTSSTPSRVSRRRFFIGGAAAVGLLGAAYAGGWWWYKVRTGDTEDLILSILRRNLSGLGFTEADMRQFALDMQERFSKHRRIAALGMLGPIYEHVNVYKLLPISRVSFRHFEDTIVSDFLLSTDFFQRHAETVDGPTYLGPFSTYTRICANPFAQFEEN